MTIRNLIIAVMLVAGVTGVKAYNETNWTGVSPHEAATSTETSANSVYLYNVGKKMFLGEGGNWGVEALLSDVGVLYQITENTDWNCFYFYQGEGSGYLCPVTQNNDDRYKLYFLSAHSDSYGFNLTETSTGSGKYRISYDSGNYYMVATSVEGTTAGADENHRICIVEKSALENVTDESDLWILVPKQEFEEKLVDAATQSKTLFADQYAPCTYLVKDYDFARNHVDVASWVGVTADGTTSMVNSQGEMSVPSSAAVPSVTYYIGNGYGVDDSNQATYGAQWTGNIFSNGTLKQTVSNVATIGWYKVTANVGTNSTTANVKLFAQVGDETSGTGYAETKTTQTVLADVTSFTEAESLINETDKQISATVFVGKDANGNIKPLTFGVTVTDGESTAWTCMDKFTLTYLGALRNKVILDEDNTDIANMNTQNNEVAQSGQSTIFLHRTLSAGKWNSIVLPFSVSSDVIKLVFGDNTKISKLTGADDAAHPNWINFTNCTSDGIEAGKLYVINPEKVTYNSTGGTVTSSASDKLSLSKGTYYALDGNYGQSADYEENITGDSGAEVYNTDGSVTFMGTYVKKENIIPLNSYYLNGGSWKYNTTKKSHAQAFRGWLQTASSSPQKVKFVVAINGVASTDGSTTGIDGSVVTEKSSYNVYDLSGRQVMRNAKSIDSLTPGCYIVNGRKTVVK